MIHLLYNFATRGEKHPVNTIKYTIKTISNANPN